MERSCRVNMSISRLFLYIDARLTFCVGLQKKASTNIDNARARPEQNPTETGAKLAFIATQLFYSWGIRGI